MHPPCENRKVKDKHKESMKMPHTDWGVVT